MDERYRNAGHGKAKTPLHYPSLLHQRLMAMQNPNIFTAHDKFIKPWVVD